MGRDEVVETKRQRTREGGDFWRGSLELEALDGVQHLPFRPFRSYLCALFVALSSSRHVSSTTRSLC